MLAKREERFRAAILKIIDAVVYHLGSIEYANSDDSEHYRHLVSRQVEAVFELAELIGYDLWSETAEPVGKDDRPIARHLRDAVAEHGEGVHCAVPDCWEPAVPLRDRPRSLPAGSRWPSCPELCERHATLRCRLLMEHARVRRVHVGLMPLPEVAHLALSPEVLGQFERILRSVPKGADRPQESDPPN